MHVRSLMGEVVETGGGLAVDFAEPIDLGIVYRASAIAETVDLLLKGAGHVRAEADPSG